MPEPGSIVSHDAEVGIPNIVMTSAISVMYSVYIHNQMVQSQV